MERETDWEMLKLAVVTDSLWKDIIRNLDLIDIITYIPLTLKGDDYNRIMPLNHLKLIYMYVFNMLSLRGDVELRCVDS